MKVFFYGLFMDEEILAKKQVTPTSTHIGFVDGYKLRIGNRATLLHNPGSQAYGVLMDVDANEVRKLYAEASVSDYAPEPVTVQMPDGSRYGAVCYNLPLEKVTGTNMDYARSLLSLATRLQLPGDYLEQIAQEGN